MTKKAIFVYAGLISFIYVSCIRSSQKPPAIDDYYEKCRKLVISEDSVGMSYFFSRQSTMVDEMIVVYLGKIITTEKDTIKVINTINYSGHFESKHGDANFYLYNYQDKRIGYYYVGSDNTLPKKIENGYLVFNNTDGSCKETTSINFKDSIPQTIFVKCEENQGDLFRLYSD